MPSYNTKLTEAKQILDAAMEEAGDAQLYYSSTAGAIDSAAKRIAIAMIACTNAFLTVKGLAIKGDLDSH